MVFDPTTVASGAKYLDEANSQKDSNMSRSTAVLLARSLWRIESERSTGTFTDGPDRSIGHENCCLPFLDMMRTQRVRRSYDHRLRDVIAATGNADLFRDVAIPASTRYRTWARGEIVRDPWLLRWTLGFRSTSCWSRIDSLRQRAKVQAAIIEVTGAKCCGSAEANSTPIAFLMA